MPRKPRPLDRDSGVVRDASLIVIASEDTQAVGAYFAHFQPRRVQFRVLPTENGRSASEHILQRLNDFRSEFHLEDDDQLWYCGDTDHWVAANHIANLVQVLQRCSQAGYHVALSNPCFELWLLLHFSDIPSDIQNCQSICDKLSVTAGGYSKLHGCHAPITSAMVLRAAECSPLGRGHPRNSNDSNHEDLSYSQFAHSARIHSHQLENVRRWTVHPSGNRRCRLPVPKRAWRPCFRAFWLAIFLPRKVFGPGLCSHILVCLICRRSFRLRRTVTFRVLGGWVTNRLYRGWVGLCLCEDLLGIDVGGADGGDAGAAVAGFAIFGQGFHLAAIGVGGTVGGGVEEIGPGGMVLGVGVAVEEDQAGVGHEHLGHEEFLDGVAGLHAGELAMAFFIEILERG